MAAKKRRSKIFVYRTHESLALGALADNTVVSSNFDDGPDERCFVPSLDYSVSVKNLTAGQGPVMVGLAHADYTDAQIEEWLETQSLGWGRADLREQEIMNRKIREIALFNDGSADQVYNDGRIKRLKLRWTLVSGDTLKLWAYNLNDATLTTGGIVDFNATVYWKPA